MKKKIKFNNKKKIINSYYTNLYLNGGEIASGAINAAEQAIQSGIQAGQIADTSKMEENIKAISTANIGENAKSTNDLMNAWNSIDWQSGTSKEELYGDHDQRTAQAFQGMAQGAAQGKGLFGKALGIAGSALGTIIGSTAAAAKAKKKAKEINQKANLANANQLSAFQNSASNLSENTNLNALSTYAAEGGPLFTNGGQFGNGVTYINEGGTHEENIYDGVPQGIAPDGNPNLVEEGEVIYNDYVYSNRLKPDKKLLETYNLPTKYKNKTFAEIADDLSKESKERQYDPISKKGLEDSMNKLQQVQDKFKEIKKQKQLNQLMSKLTNDDLSLLSEITQLQQPQQTMFDTGGQENKKQQRQEKWNEFKEGLKNPEILRTIPIGVKGAMALSDALGYTNKTDYSNPNLIAKNTRIIDAPTIGNYMAYNPLDPNYMMNQQRQLAMANQNAIMNASMGNAGTTMAGLLANSYNNQIAQGDAYRKAMEENLKQRQLVEDFNRGTNVQNAQMMLDADKANQKTFLESGLAQTKMREEIDQALSGARSANLDNFLASLGDLGKETTDRNAVNTTIDKTGIPGAEDFKRKCGGKLKRNKKSKYFKTL